MQFHRFESVRLHWKVAVLVRNEHSSKYSPQILSGASNSSNIGCDKNISRDFKHSPLISISVNCTFIPGFSPRTENKRKHITSAPYKNTTFSTQLSHFNTNSFQFSLIYGVTLVTLFILNRINIYLLIIFLLRYRCLTHLCLCLPLDIIVVHGIQLNRTGKGRKIMKIFADLWKVQPISILG